MPIKEDLSLSPLPVDERTAPVLYLHFKTNIDALGSRETAASKIVEAIYALPADATPSEQSRLQNLYAQVYTRTELEQLVLNSFAALGL